MKTLKTIVVIAALILSAGAGFFVNYYLMNKNEDLNLKTEKEVEEELPHFMGGGVVSKSIKKADNKIFFIVEQQHHASKEELKPSLHQEVELKAFMGILREVALFLENTITNNTQKAHLKIGEFNFSCNEEFSDVLSIGSSVSEKTKDPIDISAKAEYTLMHKNKQILKYTTSFFAQETPDTEKVLKESVSEKLTMSEELKRTDYAFYQLLQQIQRESGIKITVKTCRVKDEDGNCSLYMTAFFKLPVKNNAGNNPSK